MKIFSIGEVSREFECSKEKIRYLEGKIDLVPMRAGKRRDRIYSVGDVKKIGDYIKGN